LNKQISEIFFGHIEPLDAADTCISTVHISAELKQALCESEQLLNELSTLTKNKSFTVEQCSEALEAVRTALEAETLEINR
jgi:hypothetical protein